MKRLKHLLGQKEFLVCVFCFCLLLFNWPLVSFADGGELKRMFIYLFGAWAIIIFLMALVSLDLSTEPRSKASESHKKQEPQC